MTALPVSKLNFGGLTFDIQSGAFRLGNLQCFGRAEPDSAGSCADLKLAGVTRSGVYNVQRPGEQFYRVVQCDMGGTSYEEVGEEQSQPPHLSVCGYQDQVNDNSVSVTYDSILHNVTNMPMPSGTGLNIDSGIFTTPVSAVYSISWGLSAYSSGGHAIEIYLRKNGIEIDEISHYSYTTEPSRDQGGRNIHISSTVGDTFDLFCVDCSTPISFITFCITMLQPL